MAGKPSGTAATAKDTPSSSTASQSDALCGAETSATVETTTQAMMVTTFRADALVAFQISCVEHRFTRRAFAPESFGHTLVRAFVAFDLGGEEFLQPAH